MRIKHKQIQRGGSLPYWRWRDFTRTEMACRHCGEEYYWPEFMDRLQQARNQSKSPYTVHSAHRCSLHNARIGGAPLSQHLRLAVDIGLSGHSPSELLSQCRNAGFRGFGFYTTFLHIDLGRARFWYGSRKAENLWQTWLD
ncbi:MAG TPA: hypothetical protein ENJ42_08435 [Hellea balneolensis]|uniref:Peptidase M15A C-terminal domain-containing protein n=1 Tax=Hellea balneolensis TaxID=287478 RepID=A0A7C5LW09_9PROT|nr:hypothetical protein [Hellea balneolensis]